ncbi:MAG: plastocyanin/azurin family copper-binding protein [Halobacteria archaeon]
MKDSPSTTKTTRRRYLSLTALTLAGCISDKASGDTGADRVVEMDDNSFDPRKVEVKVGDTVEWRNESEFGHTVTCYGDKVPDQDAYFASGGFGSEEEARNHIQEGLIEPGNSYRHRFDTPGKYRYFCIPHEASDMTGTVVVRDS